MMPAIFQSSFIISFKSSVPLIEHTSHFLSQNMLPLTCSGDANRVSSLLSRQEPHSLTRAGWVRRGRLTPADPSHISPRNRAPSSPDSWLPGCWAESRREGRLQRRRGSKRDGEARRRGTWVQMFQLLVSGQTPSAGSDGACSVPRKHLVLIPAGRLFP